MFDLKVGDCREVMAEMEAGSVDAIVTDPPYGLSFMGKDWDHGVPGIPFWAEALRVAKPGAHLVAFGGTRTFHRLTCAIEDAGWEIRDCLSWLYGSGFPKSLDVSKAIDKAAGAARGAGRRLAPVGERPNAANMTPNRHCLDCGKWTFSPDPCRCPKDGGPVTVIAERWNGWGTALKPAWEPIILARKPLAGTVAANVLQWSVGGLNIDNCRVQAHRPGDPSISGEAEPRGCAVHGVRHLPQEGTQVALAGEAGKVADHLRAGVSLAPDGGSDQSPLARRRLRRRKNRVPPDSDRLAFEGRPAIVADSASAIRPGAPDGDGPTDKALADIAGAHTPRQRKQDGQPPGESLADGLGRPLARTQGSPSALGDSGEGESGSPRCTCHEVAIGRWPANVCLDEEAAAQLDAQSGERGGGFGISGGDPAGHGIYSGGFPRGNRTTVGFGDSGGASRFFYTSKASSGERHYAGRNPHPTVKPVDLMRWLCRLVTPPGGLVLDPFMGSGSTGIAALAEGFRFAGVELDPEMVKLARRRIGGPLYELSDLP